MSAPNYSGPIPVEVANLPERKRYTSTTIRTYIVDPAGASGDGKNVQIASYEPTRERMVLIVADAAVALTLEAPKSSPDTGAAATAPQGGYLPPNTNMAAYEFYGPDAWYLNSLTTLTRVTVIKEYCMYGNA